jgi:hypothetical protein
MRATGYLLPPVSVNDCPFYEFIGDHKFAFTLTYGMLVDGLDCIFEFVNESLKLIRTKGLSIKNISLCLENMNRQLRNKGARIDRVCQSIKCYLQEEQNKLADGETVWHASSDVIESILGTYKFKKSKNQLNGITPSEYLTSKKYFAVS